MFFTFTKNCILYNTRLLWGFKADPFKLLGDTLARFWILILFGLSDRADKGRMECQVVRLARRVVGGGGVGLHLRL